MKWNVVIHGHHNRIFNLILSFIISESKFRELRIVDGPTPDQGKFSYILETSKDIIDLLLELLRVKGVTYCDVKKG